MTAVFQARPYGKFIDITLKKKEASKKESRL